MAAILSRAGYESRSEFLRSMKRVIGDSRTNVADLEELPHLSYTNYGRCNIARITSPPSRVEPLYAVTPGGETDSVRFLYQLKGNTEFQQDEYSGCMGPESFLIYDPAHECKFISPISTDHLVLFVPRQVFEMRALASYQRPRLFSAGNLTGLTRIAASAMQAYFAERGALDARSRDLLESNLLAIARQLVTTYEQPQSAEPTGLSMLRSRIVSYLDDNIQRPGLTAKEIAKRMGCSPRYVYRAFEGQGTTPERFIWDLRLSRAKQQIGLFQKCDRSSLAQVAYDCGFTSYSHFSRAFKTKYGHSPRQMQRLSTLP